MLFLQLCTKLVKFDTSKKVQNHCCMTINPFPTGGTLKYRQINKNINGYVATNYPNQLF